MEDLYDMLVEKKSFLPPQYNQNYIERSTEILNTELNSEMERKESPKEDSEFSLLEEGRKRKHVIGWIVGLNNEHMGHSAEICDCCNYIYLENNQLQKTTKWKGQENLIAVISWCVQTGKCYLEMSIGIEGNINGMEIAQKQPVKNYDRICLMGHEFLFVELNMQLVSWGEIG